ncbi:MAG: hypothetical protein ACD_38C00129G0003 [uncultured bacterium]|nr:MAG: hypothetical protein ACD_38C00129G0003 [uncultured bacterium]
MFVSFAPLLFATRETGKDRGVLTIVPYESSLR